MKEDPSDFKWDFIIVGAGICGVSLGALLANDGYKVLILEKTYQLGGRAKVVEQEGFILDYGIHTVRFGKKSALAKTLETIRESGQKSIEFKELGTSFFFLESIDPPQWEVLPTGLSGITKGNYFNLSKLRKILIKLITAKKEKNLAVSVKDWQGSKIFNEPSKLYLRLVTGSMQVCPFLERASMGELRRNLAEVVKKRIAVAYPVGGWKLIFKRLTDKIEKQNGKILTNQKVDKIIIENKQAVGVKAKEKAFYAKNIIISTMVREMFTFLEENLCVPAFIERCKRLQPTGGLSLDIALKTKVSNKTGLFYFDNPLSFGFFTSNLDKSCAPENKQLFTICSLCNIEGLSDSEFRDNLLVSIKSKVIQGFPEMKENILFERPLFTIFDGVEVNIHQYQELRPQFKVPGIRNLYLVGDSTAGKGAGGDIGHNSVWDAYSLIMKERTQ